MKRATDFYLEHPLFTDALIMIIALVLNGLFPKLILVKFDLASQANILSSLVGTSVSLAGFILAALTIIVSFRSNIACKTAELAKNPLELIFSTHQYQNIVRIFKDAIIELTGTFVILYIFWILSANLRSDYILFANVYGAILIFLSLFRTLFMLFLVLKLDSSDEK